MAMASVTNWFWTVVLALVTRPLFKYIHGWLFIIFAIICLVNITFVSLFLKETKGKTNAEVAALYDKTKPTESDKASENPKTTTNL